jgi:hypothetical protein
MVEILGSADLDIHVSFCILAHAPQCWCSSCRSSSFQENYDDRSPGAVNATGLPMKWSMTRHSTASTADRDMLVKLTDWRHITTRYDCCAHTFLSVICMAASVAFYLTE